MTLDAKAHDLAARAGKNMAYEMKALGLEFDVETLTVVPSAAVKRLQALLVPPGQIEILRSLEDRLRESV